MLLISKAVTVVLMCVISGDLKVAKQLLNHPAMQGRSPATVPWKKAVSWKRGTVGKQVHRVLFSDGPIWGREELINEEVKAFTEALKTYRGEPIDMAGKFFLPILNSLWRITVGQRFDYDDPKLRWILAKLTEFFQNFWKGSHQMCMREEKPLQSTRRLRKCSKNPVTENFC